MPNQVKSINFVYTGLRTSKVDIPGKNREVLFDLLLSGLGNFEIKQNNFCFFPTHQNHLNDDAIGEAHHKNFIAFKKLFSAKYFVFGSRKKFNGCKRKLSVREK